MNRRKFFSFLAVTPVAAIPTAKALAADPVPDDLTIGMSNGEAVINSKADIVFKTGGIERMRIHANPIPYSLTIPKPPEQMESYTMEWVRDPDPFGKT